MTWAAATRNEPPHTEELEIADVRDALVTPFARGPLRTQDGPFRWIRGAVHDREGRLVHASQRIWNGEPQDPVPADPGQVRVPFGTRRLRGSWLYAGHWSGHFGHFLVETLPNLWPDPSTYAASLSGILAHRGPRGRVPTHGRVRLQSPEPPPWQRQLVELSGYGGGPLRVVHDRPVRVERLVVPARPVVIKRWAMPAAVAVWRRVSEAVGSRGPHPRVYLSRSRFHAEADRGADRARTDEAWDTRLDAIFAEAGFHVTHPETLPIADQIELVRGAETLAGLSGSAMHLSAFAEPGTRVLSIGDRRTPRRPPHSQAMIDGACGHLTAFVRDRDDAGLAGILAALDEG